MQGVLPYLLMPVMACLLVLAQALWGSVIKNQHALKGNAGTIANNLFSNPRMWLGALIYIIATLLYFYMLSRLRFFSVQLAMTGLSIAFSTLLAFSFFHESISAINILGAFIVLAGVGLVLYK
jgi:drug/metabolite transporter (DMT)-like permease